MEWDILFTNSFEFAKKDLTNYYSKKPDEITPKEQTILTGLSKLPFPVGIIDISVDNKKYPHLEDDIIQLIHYDLEKMGMKQTTYFGKISSNKDELTNVLVQYFKIDKNDSNQIADDITINFEYTGFFPSRTSRIRFTRYNIKNNPKRFYDDFRHLFITDFNEYFMAQYDTEVKVDFNLRYKLKSDTVLSDIDLLVPDVRTSLSLEKLQEIVSDMQFSPHVPKSIQEEFQRAKDLFVFCYFKYEFYTLSVRSALFSHESAMKLRYIQSLGNKAIIKHNSEILQKYTDPSYHDISNSVRQLMRQKGWKLKHITVNDKKFPLTMKNIMNWLIENGIPKWKFQMYHAGNYLRNSMAHTEQQIILSPSSTILHNIVYDINEIFEMKTK